MGCVFATHSDKEKKKGSKITTHPTRRCAVHRRPSRGPRRRGNILLPPVLQKLTRLWGDSSTNSSDETSRCPSDFWVSSSTLWQYYSPPSIKARRDARLCRGEAPISGGLLAEQSFHPRSSPEELSTAAPTIASEPQPESSEAFCFPSVACPKAWPSLPPPSSPHCLAFQGLDWLLPPDAEEIL